MSFNKRTICALALSLASCIQPTKSLEGTIAAPNHFLVSGFRSDPKAPSFTYTFTAIIQQENGCQVYQDQFERQPEQWITDAVDTVNQQFLESKEVIISIQYTPLPTQEKKVAGCEYTTGITQAITVFTPMGQYFGR